MTERRGRRLAGPLLLGVIAVGLIAAAVTTGVTSEDETSAGATRLTRPPDPGAVAHEEGPPRDTLPRQPEPPVLFSGSRPGSANYMRSLIPPDPVLDETATRDLNERFPMSGRSVPRTRPVEWSHNVYNASESDPGYVLDLEFEEEWGCSTDQGNGSSLVRIPDYVTKALPRYAEDPESDGWLTVVNVDTGVVTALWRAVKESPTTWSAACAGTFHLDGSGWPRDGGRIAGAGTGAGHAAGAGVITLSDLQSGVIDHALVVASNSVSPTFREPADVSDGVGNFGGLLEPGMRLQLDPVVDCAGLPDATPFEAMVCVAAQRYGLYVGDQTTCCDDAPYWGGVTLNGDDLTDPARQNLGNAWESSGSGIRGEPLCTPISATCGAYAHYGVRGLPDDLARIPWKGNMRVLQRWDGS